MKAALIILSGGTLISRLYSRRKRKLDILSSDHVSTQNGEEAAEEEEAEAEATWIKARMEMGRARSGPGLSLMDFL